MKTLHSPSSVRACVSPDTPTGRPASPHVMTVVRFVKGGVARASPAMGDVTGGGLASWVNRGDVCHLCTQTAFAAEGLGLQAGRVARTNITHAAGQLAPSGGRP